MTPEALRSRWVREEVNSALNQVRRGRMHAVIPVVAMPVDEDEVPPLWAALQRYDATVDYDRALAGLCRAIGLAVPSVQPSSPPPMSPPFPETPAIMPAPTTPQPAASAPTAGSRPNGGVILRRALIAWVISFVIIYAVFSLGLFRPVFAGAQYLATFVVIYLATVVAVIVGLVSNQSARLPVADAQPMSSSLPPVRPVVVGWNGRPSYPWLLLAVLVTVGSVVEAVLLLQGPQYYSNLTLSRAFRNPVFRPRGAILAEGTMPLSPL
jgi:hypothetical protein